MKDLENDMEEYQHVLDTQGDMQIVREILESISEQVDIRNQRELIE
jgi:hypothetical protein